MNGEVVLSFFGVGAGEGPAAVCGYQSEGQGIRVEMPAFSSGDRNGRAVTLPLPGTNSVLFPATTRAAAPVAARVDDRPPVAAIVGGLPVGGLSDEV